MQNVDTLYPDGLVHFDGKGRSCHHIWSVGKPKKSDVCHTCKAVAVRDERGKIVEYDVGIAVPEFDFRKRD